MSSQLRLIFLILLFYGAKAAPKTYSCMSYMEDDHSVMQDDDEYEQYPSSASSNGDGSSLQINSAENAVNSAEDVNPLANAPHRRICPSDYTFCFSLWRQTENGTRIEKQGCWKESNERNAICSHSECTSSTPTSRNTTLYYCCCSGDICNQNVTVVEPAPLLASKPIYSKESNVNPVQASNVWSNIMSWCLLVVVIVFICVIFSLLYFNRRGIFDKAIPEEAPLAPCGPGYSSNLRNVDNINLVSMLGSGKYGTVMKGILHDQEVAVKIYPESHYQYYVNERNIYSLPMMECPSLLSYLGYDERHTMEGKVEYQLVLSLAPLGCLQDWLIANTSDFEVFCGMAKTITRGLSHLHTELKRGDELKPCIAHRDLNSRNILVKADRTCCIADFGFALKVFGSRYEYKGEVAMAETKSINEVGTLRYMSPELLEGAVNLRDCESSLKQMDVYALGLVLWEVASRCVDFYASAQITPTYKAPYEQEVGAHPSFDQMQTVVVRHKARPLFPAGWGGGPACKLVRDTCEDCWDHDAEARLTSLCAEERMQEVASLRTRLNVHSQANSPLLSTNNFANNIQSSVPTNSRELESTLNPPPNQQLIPNSSSFVPPLEKNHFNYVQHQIQPYQGRNPCQERNLAQSAQRTPQILVEKSKKHSFQSSEENSFSCLEDDVSVEELISGKASKKFYNLGEETSTSTASMGQGFPKQHNFDKKLKGWHGVRALIHKKLFRKQEGTIQGEDDILHNSISYNEEKSNLVENRSRIPLTSSSVSYIDDNKSIHNAIATTSTSRASSLLNAPHNRRPNNLDISPKSNIMHSCIVEEASSHTDDISNGNVSAHVVSRSHSANLFKAIQHNNNILPKVETVSKRHTTTGLPHKSNSSYSSPVELRRQRSLEVFREVFSGQGSTDRLRDPSQRVKTPGDVPPSVRKIRASKTLSLYDDRMMDSSLLKAL